MSINALFLPKSIAVIGASTKHGSVGNEIAKNLATQGYRGRLHFVNLKGGRLYGHKIEVDLSRIKKPLDLAIVAIPAAFVVDELKKLAALETQSAVVISAGFGEVGNHEGQVALARICRENNITLIGPNCLGILNPEVKLNASFAPLMPRVGNIAFVSQSGAICASVLDYARQRDLGFSKFVSVGNKALVGEVELLEYLYHDTKTHVIAIYMEDVDEVDFLKQIVEKITHGKVHKPIVVLKSGRTKSGRAAALSHTGSLGGSDSAFETLFSQTGIIRADSVEELFDIIECFSRNRLLVRGRVAVITNAGGPGVLTADALVGDGLTLAKLEAQTVDKLRKFLPAAASCGNPVDILGDANADRYEKTLLTILEDSGVDAVQIILTPQSMTEVVKTARAIVALRKKSKKPLIVTFMGQGLVEAGVEILNKNKIATSYFPEGAAKALGALFKFDKWINSDIKAAKRFGDVNPKIVSGILEQFGKTHLLPIYAAFDVLAAYGLPVRKRWLVQSRAEAAALSEKIKGQVALKIVSADVNHKSDVGGVVLNVETSSLASSYEKLVDHIHKKLPKAAVDGVLVMPMEKNDGIEMIIGVSSDVKLGKQILVGLGGVYTEVYRDLSWGLAPLTPVDIERMIAHLKTAKILAGYRGHAPLAEKAVEEALGRLSQLVMDFPVIGEVDINPLFVMDEKLGSVVLDARITLGDV